MVFSPFDAFDFQQVTLLHGTAPQSLVDKTNELRRDLGAYPEFKLHFFRQRLARRPHMRGRNGLVFGPARWGDRHWFLYDVGGDQNQVQLNIGMCPNHIRVGLGFMIGRQVAPKPPAFHVFQTFLALRPPLPFRNALLETIAQHGLRIEIQGQVEPATDPAAIVACLETYHVPSNKKETVFVFLGHIWSPTEAAAKDAAAFRAALSHLLPFYEFLILGSGSFDVIDFP